MTDSITIPLSLAPASQPLRQAVAWLVPSADPLRCLTEICGWRVDLMDTRLVPLPHSRTNPDACALLAIPPKGSKPDISHALPYGWEGTKLLIPVDAILRPALTAAELDGLITAPLAVWHPVLGLVECDAPADLRVWDLLEAPRVRSEDWNAAQHGESDPPRLRSIGLRMELLARDPFGGAGEEIGKSPLKDIPPVPGEPSRSASAQAARKLVGGLLLGGAALAGGLEKLGNMLLSPFGGGAAAGPAKPGSVREWLEKQSAAFFERLERAREAEINRLMDWLNKDPEMALKFALPIEGVGEASRGIAPPGAKLGARNINFQLGAIGGGGAADIWNVQEEQRRALIAKYRELANLALAEGRHRRAAYIFAQLLGDLTAAAEALLQGRFHAEGAVLYRDRLLNKRRAAQCFAEGGLLGEAVKLLEELGEWVEAGDLHARLEMQDDARRCYQNAVDEAQRNNDQLRAALLTEEKLGSPPDALKLLQSAWPNHPQGFLCLTAEFDFHVRHGQPEAARDRVRTMRDAMPPTYELPRLCTLLTALSRTYPDGEVRQLTRVLAVTTAATVLSHPSIVHQQRVLQSLTELHPQDRLFQRDSHRFLHPPSGKPEARPHARAVNLPRHATASGKDGQLVRGEQHRIFGLDRAHAAAFSHGTLAVVGEVIPDALQFGIRHLHLRCVAVDQRKTVLRQSWTVPPLLLENIGSYLSMSWVNRDHLWVRHALAEPLETLTVGLLHYSDAPTVAGTLHRFPLDAISMDTSEAGWVKTLRPNGTVTCHQDDGTLIWTHGTPFYGAILRGHRGFAVRRERIVLAVEDCVWLIRQVSSGYEGESFAFGQKIVSCAVNSPFARPLIAVGLERGVGLLSLENPEPGLVNGELSSPLVIFTARGTLLAFGDGAALAIEMRGDGPPKVHEFPWDQRPIAVTPGPERDEVIVVFRDGSWQIVEFRPVK